MLSDVALRSIAYNLAALRLDPLLHLKIAAAIVAPLMRGDATAQSSQPLSPLKLRSPPKKAPPRKKAWARKVKPEPIPIVHNGKIFPSRGAMAKHLATVLGKSPTTLARALLDAGDDAEAVVRRYRPEQPAPRLKALSHDEIAMRFLRERLAEGPFVAGILDDEIKAGRLRGGPSKKPKRSSASSPAGSTTAAAASCTYAQPTRRPSSRHKGAQRHAYRGYRVL
jgi:hypothetical protein